MSYQSYENKATLISFMKTDQALINLIRPYQFYEGLTNSMESLPIF